MEHFDLFYCSFCNEYKSQKIIELYINISKYKCPECCDALSPEDFTLRRSEIMKMWGVTKKEVDDRRKQIAERIKQLKLDKKNKELNKSDETDNEIDNINNDINYELLIPKE